MCVNYMLMILNLHSSTKTADNCDNSRVALISCITGHVPRNYLLRTKMFSKSKNDKQPCFHLGGNMIPQQDTVKDLGIHVDNQLRFTNHVNQIVAKH